MHYGNICHCVIIILLIPILLSVCLVYKHDADHHEETADECQRSWTVVDPKTIRHDLRNKWLNQIGIANNKWWIEQKAHNVSSWSHNGAKNTKWYESYEHNVTVKESETTNIFIHGKDLYAIFRIRSKFGQQAIENPQVNILYKNQAHNW